MNGYLIFLIIITVISICALVYINSYTRLKTYNDKINNAENTIKKNIKKKAELINLISKTIKRVLKKDYLKEYSSLKNSTIDLIEKDELLDAAEELFHELYNDHAALRRSKDAKKVIEELREINELITSAKSIYNNNAKACNDKIKKFPHNIIAKFSKIETKLLFNNNKTDDLEN